MDAAAEEGIRTGKLRPGRRTVAGVVTTDVYAVLVALRTERGLATMSRAVGEALKEWALTRAPGSFNPHGPTAEEATRADGDPGSKPTEPREVALSTWQEVRGVVRAIAEEGHGVRVALEEGGDVVSIRLPGIAQDPHIEVGARVAILRTDATPEYVARPLD